jgi:hypothetical protein
MGDFLSALLVLGRHFILRIVLVAPPSIALARGEGYTYQMLALFHFQTSDPQSLFRRYSKILAWSLIGKKLIYDIFQYQSFCTRSSFLATESVTLERKQKQTVPQILTT